MSDVGPAAFPLTRDAVARALRQAFVREGKKKLFPVSFANAAAFAEAVVVFAPYYGVTTLLRLGHFLSQCVVEGAWLRTTTEYASGADYEGRHDLGNTRPGDGRRFHGHGRIQTTGRANHRRATETMRRRFPNGVQWRGKTWMVPDFEAQPTALAAEPWATLGAFEWWDQNGANAEADAGDDADHVRRISRGVNRGSYASPKRANAETERVDCFCGVMSGLRAEGLT